MSKVNYYKEDVYQSLDGMRIKHLAKAGEVESDRVPEEDLKDQKDNMFVGILQILTQVGPRELDFEIESVNNVDEAFSKYPEVAKKVVEDFMKKLNEDMSRQSIITASENDLKNLR